MNPLAPALIKRIGVFLVLVSLSLVVWAVNFQYHDARLSKLLYSLVAVAAGYLLLRIGLEELIARRIQEARTRYSFRKTTQILFYVISFVIILRIWIVNPQALLVAYGLFAAGVAIALQDLVKNFAGSVVIFLTGIYQVGNRIELAGRYGDVIDINLLYTTLLEIREWVDGDQATGRITSLPNGLVLSTPVNNYTKDHHFLWDEIALPVTYASDWKQAAQLMREIATRETAAFAAEATRSLAGLEEKYYLFGRPTEPAVFVTATDNWIMLRLRYVVEVRQRRSVHNRLSELILQAVQQTTTIHIASSTVSIVDFPGARPPRQD
jgi:small-conductance mechanosensitive channel